MHRLPEIGGQIQGRTEGEAERWTGMTNTQGTLSIGSGSLEAGAQEQRDGRALDLVQLKSQRVQGPSI